MKKGEKWKTLFWTWYGYYKYLVMLFRLTNITAICQDIVNDRL